MLDTVVLTALIERCAPEQRQAPLGEIVRLASGGEPLTVVVIERGRAIPIQASTRSEAIALATEIRLAGTPMKVGLAGIDSRDLDRLGVSLSDAFEPCANIRAAGRLLAEDQGRLGPRRLESHRAPTAQRSPPPRAELPASSGDAVEPHAAEGTIASAVRSWDVYAQGFRSSTLVYGVRE